MAEANKGRANKGRCAGKLALVTGAAQGLGRAHATRLAEEGARVLCTDRNGEGAEETARLINEEFGEGTAFACRRLEAVLLSQCGFDLSWLSGRASADARTCAGIDREYLQHCRADRQRHHAGL